MLLNVLTQLTDVWIRTCKELHQQLESLDMLWRLLVSNTPLGKLFREALKLPWKVSSLKVHDVCLEMRM